MTRVLENLADGLHLTVCRVFFACGVLLIYSGLARLGIILGPASTVAHIWYVLAGTVLIAAAFLKLLGKEQGTTLKVLSWGFLSVSVLMGALFVTLYFRFPYLLL